MQNMQIFKIFMLEGKFLMFEYACIHLRDDLPHSDISHRILWSKEKKTMCTETIGDTIDGLLLRVLTSCRLKL